MPYTSRVFHLIASLALSRALVSNKRRFFLSPTSRRYLLVFFVYTLLRYVMMISTQFRLLRKVKVELNMRFLKYIIRRSIKDKILAYLNFVGEVSLAIGEPAVLGAILQSRLSRRLHCNAPYGTRRRNNLDVYSVVGSGVEATGKSPVVIFVHGGAWAFGHKWQCGVVGEELARQGFVTVVPDYSVYPEGNVEDMLDDLERVIRWTRDHIHYYGGDMDQIYLVGHSSGAHLCSLLLVQRAIQKAGVKGLGAEMKPLDWEAYLYNEDSPPVPFLQEDRVERTEEVDSIKGFIGLSGPYDIVDHYVHESQRVIPPFFQNGVHRISPMLPAMLGEANFELYSPQRLLQKMSAKRVRLDFPPMCLVHGARDETVPLGSSRRFHELLKKFNARSTIVVLPEGTHVDTLLGLFMDTEKYHPTLVGEIKKIITVQQADKSQSQAAANPSGILLSG